MAKPNLQQLLNSGKNEDMGAAPVKAAAKAKTQPAAAAPVETAKVRQIHKEGEVNISAYFPAEVKAALRHVQAKNGNNVKECLAEALRDLFRKHNVVVPLELEEGR